MQVSVGIINILGKALIKVMVAPLSKSITWHKIFINQPCGED